MREELLDDDLSSHLNEEDATYLQELQQHPPVLQKLAIAFGAYVVVDMVALIRVVLQGGYESAFYLIIWQLLIDALIVFLARTLWKQKNEQALAEQRDFEYNEEILVGQNYRVWQLLGLILLLFSVRVLFFMMIY